MSGPHDGLVGTEDFYGDGVGIAAEAPGWPPMVLCPWFSRRGEIRVALGHMSGVMTHEQRAEYAGVILAVCHELGTAPVVHRMAAADTWRDTAVRCCGKLRTIEAEVPEVGRHVNAIERIVLGSPEREPWVWPEPEGLTGRQAVGMVVAVAVVATLLWALWLSW